ncbi:MAG: EAL domain-containing protein [Helicobacteraceae bacterium]|nr:EAL domain-containing protein [Helicobacteraceae bacterium]
MITIKQKVKGDEFFDYLFDRQALLYHLGRYPKNLEVMAVLFELEDLDEWFSIYSPNVVCKAGEEVLATINEILPINTKFFQISDDKYCILFDEANARKGIEFAHILKTIILERKSFTNLSNLDINISIGLAVGKAEYILPKVFSALKDAKKILSKIYFLDSSDDNFSEIQNKEIEWNKLIKHAIQGGRIVPFYQPIYDNRTGHITKFECLSRLIDNGRVLYPFDFFRQARRMGFMRSITYSVINHSFKAFANNDFEFSINITEEDIRDTQMIDYLKDYCDKYNIKPQRIIIELLEDIEFSDDDLIINNILILKELGFQIAIDDFGYDNSNFSRLIKMQIDCIKIDGRFVKNMDIDPISYKIVKSIANFAKSINVMCIAEHVHSKSVYKLIKELDVEYSQGYFIGQATSSLPGAV